MDELRKLLKEGKLTFRQYFIVAYELFKEMIKNDNKEIIVLYVLYLVTVFFAVSQNSLFGMLSGIVTLVAISRIWLLYKKVIFKIEEREYDNNGNLRKIFALLGFSALIGFILGVMFMHYIFSLGIERLSSTDQISLLSEMRNPIIILVVIMLLIQICILYFIPVYMSRRGGFWESFRYNLYLSKGNKMRVLIPIFVIGALNVGIGQTLGRLGITGILLSTVLTVTLNIFKVMLLSIIYLNVEYTSEIPEEFSYLIGKEEETYNVVEDKIEE